MTDYLSIPRAELEALLAKLEDSRRDYAERVGRAQGYLDKWLMTAPKSNEHEEGARCSNCGADAARARLSGFGLCPTCYYNCMCLHFAGDNPRCDVHRPATGDTCRMSDDEHAAAADAALAEAIKQKLVTR